MRLFLISLLSLGVLLLVSPLFAQKRAWTSADGKSSFEGELLEYNATEVRLKRAADFKTFILPHGELVAQGFGHDQGFGLVGFVHGFAHGLLLCSGLVSGGVPG
jgi:hypothetical protein